MPSTLHTTASLRIITRLVHPSTPRARARSRGLTLSQAKADYAPYYKHSLLYLACVDVATDLTADQRLLRAHDLGISAFLGDTIYNFGELVRPTRYFKIRGVHRACGWAFFS